MELSASGVDAQERFGGELTDDRKAKVMAIVFQLSGNNEDALDKDVWS